MIRHCDGTDPNLVRLIKTDDEPAPHVLTKVPCDCGLTFNDVERLVIHPHAEIGPKPDLDQISTITHEPLTGLCLTRTDSGTPELRIVHICSRYHEHLTWKVPQPDHRCDCGFTWTDQ
jgi:hypothetical protein